VLTGLGERNQEKPKEITFQQKPQGSEGASCAGSMGGVWGHSGQSL
jgi:hypothetical protein